MPATVSTDFVFEPRVWKDHIRAYFDKKLVFGAIALTDTELKGAPGETINFPFFEAIGAAEAPAETASLTVDNLGDNSFQATVAEVGKAVGVKKRAFKVSAARTEKIVMEINEQLARVHAERIDADLLAEISKATSHEAVTPSDNTGVNIRALKEMKVRAFGDKHTDSMYMQINSLDLMRVMTDNTAGFLQADALDPFISTPGFQGRMLGMAVFEVDSVPEGEVFMHKMNPYGFIIKQDMELESDYDILAREWVFTSNEWYAVRSFHAEIDPLDRKSLKGTFA